MLGFKATKHESHTVHVSQGVGSLSHSCLLQLLRGVVTRKGIVRRKKKDILNKFFMRFPF